MKNPYLNRKMIKNSKLFFGRKNEIKEIFAEIGTTHPQSISIVGERKIGKSSLLYYVFQSGVEKRKLPCSEKYIFAFVDFHECLGITVEEFWKMLYSELKSKLPKGMGIRQVKDYKTFKNMVKILENSGYRLILLFDEFDSIIENKNFEFDFFLSLRAMANRYDVAYISSTQKNLQDLSRKDLFGSPFFNIFFPFYLGLFQEDEAIDLIENPSAEEGISLEEETEFILKNAGLFPFFIQLLCSSIFEYKMRHGSRIDQEGYDYILAEFQKESVPFFKYFWKNLSPNEKDLLVQIAIGEKVKKEMKFLVDELKQKGYITIINGKKQIFGNAFRQFILDNKTDIVKTVKKKTMHHTLLEIPRNTCLKFVWSALSILILTIISSWVYDHYFSGEDSAFSGLIGRILSIFSNTPDWTFLLISCVLVALSIILFVFSRD